MAYNLAFGSSQAMTVGTAYPNVIAGGDIPVQGFIASISTAGNAVVQLEDGSQMTLQLVVGSNYFPGLQVLKVVSQTAVGTYYQLG
jgi:hypothetical protein